jgi:hypothetical protein
MDRRMKNKSTKKNNGDKFLKTNLGNSNLIALASFRKSIN